MATSAIIGVWSTRPRIGKTTLALDLAWRTAAAHSTLIWDLSPAGTPRRAGETDPQPTRWPGLALLRTTPEPPRGPLVRWLPGRTTPEPSIDHLRETYARIILDCPIEPSATLAAADLLIVPLPPVPDVTDQLDAARHAILRATGRHPPILPVLSMVDTRQRVHREVHEGPAAGWPIIPLASLVDQATAQHTPVGAHAGWTEASQRLQAIANAIESRLGQ